MRTHVRSTIQRYNLIPAGSHVLAGVSGGADSVALLHVLHSLRSTLDMDLTVVHVNHGLRGAEADAEAEFVQSLAGRLGVPCVVEKVAVAARARAEGSSVEMAGRSARRVEGVLDDQHVPIRRGQHFERNGADAQSPVCAQAVFACGNE